MPEPTRPKPLRIYKTPRQLNYIANVVTNHGEEGVSMGICLVTLRPKNTKWLCFIQKVSAIKGSQIGLSALSKQPPLLSGLPVSSRVHLAASSRTLGNLENGIAALPPTDTSSSTRGFLEKTGTSQNQNTEKLWQRWLDALSCDTKPFTTRTGYGTTTAQRTSNSGSAGTPRARATAHTAEKLSHRGGRW